MKIGILTFHNAINYGAVLQCYALKEFLSLRGHDVQVIDYRNSYTEDYQKLVPWIPLLKENGFMNKLKLLSKSLVQFNKKRHIVKIFNDFVDRRLNISSKFSSVSKIPSDYDYIVFGSDQIWNPRLCGGFDPAFYGQFPKGNSKFVTYAVSIGNPSVITESEWKEIGSRIDAFDYLSVRELQFKQALEDRFSVSVAQCLDPTLLVNPKVLENIAKAPDIKDYVFVYNVQWDEKSEGFANFIAKEFGYKVVIGQSKPKMKALRNNPNNILLDSLSPEEFLGYIKNARITVGNSFHTIAISIAFRKDFYSTDCRKPERVKSLLTQLGLTDRHVNSTDRTIVFKKIDYSNVENKLAMMRAVSINYLSNSGLLLNQ